MSGFDLIIRGGSVVTPAGISRADVAVAEGKFVRISPAIPESGATELLAENAYIFPGIVDAHVHFNEPGRTEWEGIATGSAALAAGGGTCFCDMPLNSEPPAVTGEQVRRKRELAEQTSRLDFGLWGGLIPGNLDRLGELKDEGVMALKAFMCPSGIDSFPMADPDTLRAGMARARELGLIVGVHAEDRELTESLTAAQRALGETSRRAFLDSRPIEAELRAIRAALECAGETGCALHIVHVSSSEGIDLIDCARKAGVDVTAETCPHYLLLNEEDVLLQGAAAKCTPPLRDEAHRRGLWDDLRAGRIQTIGSDHSPAPPDMKAASDFFDVWGGIAGCQHGFELLMSKGGPGEALVPTPRLYFPILASVLAEGPAWRFRLPGKGRIAEGGDADFCIVRFGLERPILREELLTRHPISPYVDRVRRARITHTFVRGRTVWSPEGLAQPYPRGRFLRPI